MLQELIKPDNKPLALLSRTQCWEWSQEWNWGMSDFQTHHTKRAWSWCTFLPFSPCEDRVPVLWPPPDHQQGDRWLRTAATDQWLSMTIQNLQDERRWTASQVMNTLRSTDSFFQTKPRNKESWKQHGPSAGIICIWSVGKTHVDVSRCSHPQRLASFTGALYTLWSQNLLRKMPNKAWVIWETLSTWLNSQLLGRSREKRMIGWKPLLPAHPCHKKSGTALLEFKCCPYQKLIQQTEANYRKQK